MPSNEQIDKALNYVLKNTPVNETWLFPEGQNFV